MLEFPSFDCKLSSVVFIFTSKLVLFVTWPCIITVLFVSSELFVDGFEFPDLFVSSLSDLVEVTRTSVVLLVNAPSACVAFIRIV